MKTFIKSTDLFILHLLFLFSCATPVLNRPSSALQDQQFQCVSDRNTNNGITRDPANAGMCIDLFKTKTSLWEKTVSFFKRDTELKEKESKNIFKIPPESLLSYVPQVLTRTEELNFIRAEAKKMNVRVWMFGGTASSFLHYAKWDLYRQKGILDLQADRFDYDFTNIFRSTQDLDIVVDGTLEQIQQLQNILQNKFPYFTGSQKSWEVRSLRFPIGTPGDGYYKEALLNDPNFSNQNTDTNSLAMVEISESKEPVVRSLRDWTTGKNQFLEDTVSDTITYLRNPKHFKTARAKMGQNPEILSVIRMLTKAFQYDLTIDPKSLPNIQDVINKFDPKSITNTWALYQINKTAVKLVVHSNNIEQAINTLDQLGLRQKLLSMNLRGDGSNDASFWLSKEPLRGYTGKEVPKYTSGKLKKYNFSPAGRTAKDLGLDIVAHETNNMLAYESMTRSHTGDPNVLISRENTNGEAAAYGDGFYTVTGRQGARGTGLTIRFKVDPNAQEGKDFIYHDNYIVWLNKKSLKVIQESLNLGVEQLVNLVQSDKFKLDSSDKAIAENFKRRLNPNKISVDLEKLMNSKNLEDQKKFEETFQVLLTNQKISHLIGQNVINKVLEMIYLKISPLKDSKNEVDAIKYITQTGPLIEQLEKAGIYSSSEFRNYLTNTLNDKSKNFSLKKFALIENALLETPENCIYKLDSSGFEKLERAEIEKEIKHFNNSTDTRKQIVASFIEIQKTTAFTNDDVSTFRILVKNGLLNLNEKDIFGYSYFLTAVKHNSKQIIEYYLSKSEFDVNQKDIEGNTIVESLRLMGKTEIEDLLEKIRPEGKSVKRLVYDFLYRTKSLVFHEIQPGTFNMLGAPHPVTITKAFELAQTQTTQAQWAYVKILLGEKDTAKINPSKFKNGAESEVININGIDLQMKKDHPVEHVSYADIVEWLTGLNKLSEEGDDKIQKELQRIIPGHKKGHVYDLPTEAQWVFVMQNRGKNNEIYFDKADDSEVDQYAWYYKNSKTDENPNGETHAVATKKPRMIDRGDGVKAEFYDLVGNVQEWNKDWYGDLTGGIDPQGNPKRYDYVVRGGWCGSNSIYLRSDSRSGYYQSHRDSNVGFRLSRTSP